MGLYSPQKEDGSFYPDCTLSEVHSIYLKKDDVFIIYDMDMTPTWIREYYPSDGKAVNWSGCNIPKDCYTF